MTAVAPWANVPAEPDETTLKDAFAAAWLRIPDRPFEAATAVVGVMQPAKAMKIAAEWTTDQYVLSKQIELIEELGEDFFLPNKVSVLRRIYNLAQATNLKASEQLAALRLYCEVRGYVNNDKGPNVIVNQNRVMIVKDHGSDETWEHDLASQQAKLVSEARH